LALALGRLTAVEDYGEPDELPSARASHSPDGISIKARACELASARDVLLIDGNRG
jgi:hypothetical protein